eukprot:gb/GEZN01014278.1/.p1 GENE.gb/GEZN01014278.1/~~gb/GEZN01014278.1/.p1  ORF type:complete len:169 (+),score=1.99 gb/GEZN01014278.1/:31-537(+)
MDARFTDDPRAPQRSREPLDERPRASFGESYGTIIMSGAFMLAMYFVFESHYFNPIANTRPECAKLNTWFFVCGAIHFIFYLVVVLLFVVESSFVSVLWFYFCVTVAETLWAAYLLMGKQAAKDAHCGYKVELLNVYLGCYLIMLVLLAGQQYVKRSRPPQQYSPMSA